MFTITDLKPVIPQMSCCECDTAPTAATEGNTSTSGREGEKLVQAPAASA